MGSWVGVCGCGFVGGYECDCVDGWASACVSVGGCGVRGIIVILINAIP